MRPAAVHRSNCSLSIPGSDDLAIGKPLCAVRQMVATPYWCRAMAPNPGRNTQSSSADVLSSMRPQRQGGQRLRTDRHSSEVHQLALGMRPGGVSGSLIFGFNTVLAEQVPQAVQFAGEALDLLGQGRQVWVGGLPLLLTRGLVGEQLPFAVAQQRGLFEIL